MSPGRPCGPALSDRLYLRLPRADVALFRFFLEAQDNLALFSSLGQEHPASGGRMVLVLRFAPAARREVLAWLGELAGELPLDLLPAALGPTLTPALTPTLTPAPPPHKTPEAP